MYNTAETVIKLSKPSRCVQQTERLTTVENLFCRTPFSGTRTKNVYLFVAINLILFLTLPSEFEK